jgi:TldD protein
MISRDPTLERLAIARQLLLEPFGLDETDLAKTLAEIKAHKVDEADLYFQYTRAEGWSLEEGIVKTGSFSIDQAGGQRFNIYARACSQSTDCISCHAELLLEC